MIHVFGMSHKICFKFRYSIFSFLVKWRILINRFHNHTFDSPEHLNLIMTNAEKSNYRIKEFRTHLH